MFSGATFTGKGAKTDTVLCTVLEKEGKVEVARQGFPDWSPAQINQVLQVGDRLRSGLRSRATLRWSDLSVVRVDALTSMELQPPEKSGDKAQAELKSGAAYFFSREKPSEIQFRTPVASGAIRGTEFNLAVDAAGRTVLSLIDGEVSLSNAQGSETIRSGEQGIVEPGGAPKKTALIDAINIIQWALYYPAVVDAAELGLSDQEKESFKGSLEAYRDGDLLQALSGYPENRQPASNPERLLQAALLLAVGRIDEAESNLRGVPDAAPAARALRELIATVKHQPPGTLANPGTSSEWMARSYYHQSLSHLPEALEAASAAAKASPNFGASWIRVAELEFGFGRTSEALTALNRGLALSPRNAEGLALKGFLLAAEGKSTEASDYFDRAIGVDGALANAWLGRGLVRIRTGHPREGRDDLQTAATLEPQRAVLRSYLGKTFSHLNDTKHADKELALAKKLDPNDPTGWLYSALLDQGENRINEAVYDLQRSKELNDNRSIFRSRLLLDQDQAVRGANLAAIYRDAGLLDASVQEASRAVNADYANYSAHLFLAESYDALRDPNNINLRFETPALSELLVADLLAPPSASTLSQNISQQEYSRMFDANHLGLFSSTEYLSRGAWTQNGSQYGLLGNFGYAVDAFYRTDPGQRPNNNSEQLDLSFRFKEQVTPQDGLFFQAEYVNLISGDLNQYYNQASASHTLRVREYQEPNVLLGYHREWGPGSHTLFLASRFNDTLKLQDSSFKALYLQNEVTPGFPPFFPGQTNASLGNPSDPTSLAYRSELVAYSAELQQIYQTHSQTFVAGGRYQTASPETSSDLERQLIGGGSQPIQQSFRARLERLSFYAYDQWQVLDPLRLTLGLSYDRLHYPRNIDTAPITSSEGTACQVSPKAGILWTPVKDTYFRFAYTRSLGGVFFDQSVRLEPAQVGGFNQAFRSLAPESVAGLVPATHFETFGLGLDQIFKKTGTYLDVDAELLKSHGTKTIGLLTNSIPFPASADSPSSARQRIEFEEKSLIVALNQLIGKEWSLGARYKLTHANLDKPFLDIPAGTSGVEQFDPHVSALLHQVYLSANYYHPCGFLGQFNSVWSAQSNHGYSTATPGDDFWQVNVFLGYRFFQRRAEARLGLLNLAGRDYRLNPLTLYNDLPRQRTLAASFKFYF